MWCELVSLWEDRLRTTGFKRWLIMEEKGKCGRSMTTTTWLSRPCYLPRRNMEKSRSRRFQLFFRGLHFGPLSKSRLIFSGFHHSSEYSGPSNSSSSTNSGSSEVSFDDSRLCNSSHDSSPASDVSPITNGSLSRSSSVPSFPSSHSRRSSSGGHRVMDGRKPVLLERVPFGKSGKYLTVYIGARSDQCVKYVIKRSLLKHPLFQLLLKCSEDEFGEDYTFNKGVALVCDPELFLEVVKAVDDNLWSLENNRGEVGNSKCTLHWLVST